jgi:photosystem II stability/assembly factor-like uncharacterized protein
MSDRLLVATRKGLLVLNRQHEGHWHHAETHFLGEPVSIAMADPRDGTWYAALNLGHFGVKMWRRPEGAQAWTACAAPLYPPEPEADLAAPPTAEQQPDRPPAAPWTLQQIWSLEAGGEDEPGVLWAGTIPGGLFHSGDGGASWALNRALWDRPERAEWFGGGYDYPGIHSICVDPRDSRHVRVAVSCGGVWQTTDGGDTWRVTTAGMSAGYMPPERSEDPNIQDPHRMAQCRAQPDALWVQHHDGIFRSTDGGASWRRVMASPSSFGFAVAVHPRDPDTAWFVPAVKDECRVPVDGRLVVTRTRDGGRSFETLHHGLPPPPAYDLVYRHGLAIDRTGERLAMGSTTGALWVTDDGGDHWQCLSAHLPPIYALHFA